MEVQNMRSTNKKAKKNLSYFYSTLQKHLYEHFPDLLNDEEWIMANVESAEDTYMNFIEKGYSVYEAMDKAHKDLFMGLGFSRFDLIYDIVTEEFWDEIPEENYREFCKNMMGFCQEVFVRYKDEESDELRTELIGSIAAYIESLKFL